MFATCTESSLATWSVPQCSFRIEYSPAVMDEIRLEVIAAFFSVPRGGLETGGLLLGNYEEQRVVITDYVPLECEHALGPSFTLSQNDEGRLRELLAAARANPAGRRPVGWYHSHTRSEIFLSAADQELHRHYFLEPWQVALVLRPHTILPTRAAFFFREADGSIHGAASYREMVLDPLSMSPSTPETAEPAPAPLKVVVTAPEPEPARAAEPEPAAASPAQPEQMSAGEARPEPVEAPAAASAVSEVLPEPELEPVVIDLPCPNFLDVPAARHPRRFRAAAGIAAVLAIAAAGLGTRQYWLPRLTAEVRPSPAAQQPVRPSLSAALPAKPEPAPEATPAAPPAEVLSAADYQARGRELLREQRFADAIEQLTQALKLDPTMAQAFNARGYAHLRLRHYSEATADCEQALRLKPSYPNAARNLEAARVHLAAAHLTGQ